MEKQVGVGRLGNLTGDLLHNILLFLYFSVRKYIAEGTRGFITVNNNIQKI